MRLVLHMPLVMRLVLHVPLVMRLVLHMPLVMRLVLHVPLVMRLVLHVPLVMRLVLHMLSMIEAFLKQLHSELPHIKTVILQSDNAGCYQSKELLLLIATLNKNNDIRITSYIHTETQDGKVLIDAHFTKGSAHLVRFMKMAQNNRIRSIATAKGLDAALAWGGGIQNSFVQLVSLD